MGLMSLPGSAALLSFVYVSMGWATFLPAAFWTLAVTIAIGFNLMIARRVRGRPGVLPSGLVLAYVLSVAAGSAAFATQGLLFVTAADHLALLTVYTAATASLSIYIFTGTSEHRLFAAAVVPQALILCIMPFAGGLPQPLLLAFLGFCFTAAHMAFAYASNRRIDAALRKRFEADGLIARLQTADRTKSEFLANMSHELRTPLNAILGFSEVMKDEIMGPLGSKVYKAYAGDIHTSGTHLLDLINDVLDLAKIEAGRFVPDDRTVALEPLFAEVERLFAVRAAAAGVRLRLDLDRPLAVRADQRALKQALLNLVSNAIKFTPADGTITIGGRRDHLRATNIFVADTGAGIRKEDQATVFESFGQGRHDIAIAERGTGLGLPIVKGIVLAHGGAVSLDSELGRGTTVTLTLPGERALPDEACRAAA